MQNQKTKRLIAWVAMIATVCVMLFSTVFLVEHSNHTCHGNDCPICSVMEQCSNTLRTFATAIAIVVAGTIVLRFFYGREEGTLDAICCNSLVFQKVRMNN